MVEPGTAGPSIEPRHIIYVGIMSGQLPWQQLLAQLNARRSRFTGLYWALCHCLLLLRRVEELGFWVGVVQSVG